VSKKIKALLFSKGYNKNDVIKILEIDEADFENRINNLTCDELNKFGFTIKEIQFLFS